MWVVVVVVVVVVMVVACRCAHLILQHDCTHYSSRSNGQLGGQRMHTCRDW
jgi:hypothetical protein